MDTKLVEEIAKILKAVIVLCGLFGVNISPEHQTVIIEGGSVLIMFIYSMEATAKRKARKENDKPAETVSVAE